MVVKHRKSERYFNFASNFENIKNREYGQNEYEKGEYIASLNTNYFNKNRELVDPKAQIECGIPLNRIAFAAFYGDCLHEIQEVTAGNNKN